MSYRSPPTKRRITPGFGAHAISVAVLMAASSAIAKPMLSPTLEEAARSQQIVIAEYLNYEKKGDQPISDLSCVLSRFRVQKTIKGGGLNGKTINVIFCFSDGSACIPSKDWKFTDDRMPRKGSRWLLFLNKDSQSDVWRQYYHVDAYSTYRGSFGRIDATAENEKRVRALL